MNEGKSNTLRQVVSSVGNAWIVNNSKSHPGHVYYFNTLTGEAVWNLSDVEIEKARLRTQILERQHGVKPTKCPEPMGNPPTQQEVFKRELNNKQYRFNQQTNISQQPSINVFQTQQSSSAVYSEAPMNMSAFDLNVLNNQLNAFNLLATPAVYNSQASYVPRTQQFFITPTMPVVNQAQASLNIAYNQLLENENSPVMRFNCFQERTKRWNRFHRRNSNFKRGFNRNFKSRPVKTDLRDRISHRRNLNSCQEQTRNDDKSNANSNAASSHVTDEETIQDNDITKHTKERTTKENSFEKDLNGNESAVENHSRNSTETSTKINLTKLKCPEHFDMKQDEWYIVIDLNILLQEFPMLCVILESDDNCKLVVPENVMTEIKDFIASSNNIPARRIFHSLSHLIECGNACIAEIPGEDYGDTITNPVLNICFELLEEDFNVILLTKNNELLKYKKFIKINIFTIDEIKSLLEIDLSQQQTKVAPNSIRQLFTNKNDTNSHDTNPNKIGLRRKSATVTQEPINDLSTLEQKLSQECSRTSEVTMTNDAAIQTDKVTFISNDNKTKAVEGIHTDNLESSHNSKPKQITNTSQTSDSVPTVKRREIKLKRSVSNQPTTILPNNINNKPFRWRRRRTLNVQNDTNTRNNDKPTHDVQKDSNIDSVLESQCNPTRSNLESDAKDINNHNNEQIINDNSINMEKVTEISTVSDKLDSNNLRDIHTPVSEISNSYKSSLDSVNIIKGISTGGNIDRLEMQIDQEEISNNKNDSDRILNLENMSESRESSVVCVNIRRENIIIEESSCSGIISNSESNIESELSKDKFHLDEGSYNNVTKEIIMYEVENESMEESLKTKCEEWVSRFLQIMEEVLSVILLKEALFSKTALPPPWTLHEAAQCIRKYSDNAVVKRITDKLSSLLFDLSDDAGKVDINMKPCQYMMLYSYGVSLLKAIKDKISDCEDIEIAENLLHNLLNDIKNPYCNLSGFDVDPHDISIVLSNEEQHVEANEADEKIEDNMSTVPVPVRRKYNLRSSSTNTKTVTDTISLKSVKRKVNNEKLNKFSDINLKSIKRQITNNINTTKEDLCNTNGFSEDTSDVMFSSNKNIANEKPLNEPKIVRKFIACSKLEEKIKNMSVDNKLLECDEGRTGRRNPKSDNSGLVIDSKKTSKHNIDVDVSKDLMSTSKTTNQLSNNDLFKIMMKMFLQEVKNTLNDIKILCDSCYMELSNPQLLLKNRCELEKQVEYAQSHVDNLCGALDSMWDRDKNRPGGHIQKAMEKAGINIALIDEHVLRDYGKTIDICKNQAEVFLYSIREIITGFKSLR